MEEKTPQTMATKTTLKFDRRGRKAIREIFNKPIENMKLYWQLLSLMIDRDTQTTFRLEGKRSTHPRWHDYSRKTLVTKAGTWNIRYGSDMSPKRTARQLIIYKRNMGIGFTKGKMKGYEGVRRYSMQSKLLQASGGFRKSFMRRSLTDKGFTYGTTWDAKLVDDMLKSPKRQVLFVTDQDNEKYGKLFVKFYKKGLKI